MEQLSQNQRSQTNPILQTFQGYGLDQRSLITKAKLQKILNQQTHKSMGAKQFKQEMLQEIWEQSQANSRGQVKVSTIISVVQQASKILNKRIHNLKGSNGLIHLKNQQLKIRQQELRDLQQYNLEDNATINKKRRQITEIQIQRNQFEDDLREFQAEKQIIDDIFHYREPVVEAPMLPQKPKNTATLSKSLLLIFHLTNACVFFQLLACTYRMSFFSILICGQCYFLLFIGYYSDHSVSYLLIQLGVSIILDMVWIILGAFSSVMIMSVFHTDNKVFYILCMIFLLIQTVLKGLLIMILLEYRVIKHQGQYFLLLGQRIVLNKRAKSVSFRKSQIQQ